ncbi:MAG: hypothetical protein Q4B26_18675 [Eubacteriales bacterium]|nr:hypothetical protein [Eubacteriales bacterium]
MEQRNILQPNTELRFDSGAKYVVEDVIGIGSLCVLYRAYYTDSLGLKKYVKMKEYNPAKISLKRNRDLSMEVPEREYQYFLKMKERMIQSYMVSHDLTREEHISNYFSNAENIHEANGTVYIIYSYMEGQDLAHYQVKSLREAIRLTVSVAKIISRIHKAGYLYLDIKLPCLHTWHHHK